MIITTISEDVFNRHEDVFFLSQGERICLYTAADEPNQWAHVCRVYKQARRIVGRELNEDEVLTILFHDAAKGREGYPEDHGVGGAILFRELAPCLGYMPAWRVDLIAEVIERHTLKQHSGSNLGELLRSADMPEPSHLWYARKCYHKMCPKLGHEGALENAFQRTLDGKMLDGAPSLYLSVFGEILEKSFAEFQRIKSAEELGEALRAWEARHPNAPKNS